MPTKRKHRRAQEAENPLPGEKEASSDSLSNYVTTKRAAEMLGVVTDHVYRLIEGGKVKSIRLGHEWLIYVPSLERYLETKSPKGRPPSRKPQLQEDR